MKYEKDYLEKKVYLVAITITFIGCLNLGIDGLTNFNLIDKINDFLNYGKLPSKIIYIIIGLCALFLMFKRDTYLPFLGDAVYPCDILQEKTPQRANMQIEVEVPPNSLVVYWAAEEKKSKKLSLKLNLPMEAYEKYDNSGVVKADKNGVAVLKFRNPQSYKIPSGKQLKPHVHYRYCKYPGMLSAVETVKIE